MTYLIFLLVSLLLLVGFLIAVNYETRRGVRLYAEQRARLDEQVERIEFIVAHVDLGAFLHGEVRRLVGRIGHDVVHISLLTVRAIERVLTRLVRHLRAKNEMDPAPRESTREFVKTLSDFKEHLEATRPEMPDVHSVEIK